MAITKDYLNTSDLSVLAAWMQTKLVPDYFAAVTYANSTITCTDADGNTLLTIDSSNVTAYKSATNTSNMYNAAPQTWLYACMSANGAYLIANTVFGSTACMIITKTNNGKTAFITSDEQATSVCRKNIKRVAWGDTTPDTTHEFTAYTENQTQLVSFTTDAAFGDVSYTPNAFYIPIGQYYNLNGAVLTIDGVNYLTNGYWAIKDV